jgi:hypothetical protein
VPRKKEFRAALLQQPLAARDYPKSGYFNALPHKALQSEILATGVAYAASDDEPAVRAFATR